MGGFYFKCTFVYTALGLNRISLNTERDYTDIGDVFILKSLDNDEVFNFSRNTFGSSVSSMSLIVRNNERVFFRSPLIFAISRCLLG